MKHLEIFVGALLAAQLSPAIAADKPAAGGKPVKLTLGTRGDAMEFDKTKLTVKPGAQVSLTFKNTASKSSGMEHNFVLVQIGAAEKIANDSLTAGADKGWLAPSDQIIKATKLLKPGQTETITFTAPEKEGEYPFICTYPGHAALMRGILVVRK